MWGDDTTLKGVLCQRNPEGSASEKKDTKGDYMDVDVSETNMENLHEYMDKVVSKSAKQKQTNAEYLQDYFKLMEGDDSNDDDDFIWTIIDKQ